jgi:hypothetical protein
MADRGSDGRCCLGLCRMGEVQGYGGGCGACGLGDCLSRKSMCFCLNSGNSHSIAVEALNSGYCGQWLLQQTLQLYIVDLLASLRVSLRGEAKVGMGGQK